MELSIILPTYNERKNIAILIPKLIKEFDKRGIRFEIMVVDDNSPDGTKDVVLDLGKRHKNVHLLLRKKKEGIGAAIRAGYNAAKGKYILSSDTDLSFSIRDTGKLYDKICAGYDLVLGSRYAKGGYYERSNVRTLMKGMVSYLGNRFFIRTLFSIPATDFSANFRIISRKMWRAIKTKEMTNFLLFEMIFKTHLKNGRIGEIPVAFRDRKYGESKLNLSIEAPKAGLKLLGLFFKYRWGRLTGRGRFR
ncbi:glycosyltransferase [Nanoarchaeota archaeon]